MFVTIDKKGKVVYKSENYKEANNFGRYDIFKPNYNPFKSDFRVFLEVAPTK